MSRQIKRRQVKIEDIDVLNDFEKLVNAIDDLEMMFNPKADIDDKDNDIQAGLISLGFNSNTKAYRQYKALSNCLLDAGEKLARLKATVMPLWKNADTSAL